MPFSMASDTVRVLISLPRLKTLPGDAGAVAAAEQAHRELGAPGAHQPGDADDLAGVHLEVDAVDHDAGRILRVVGGPVLDAQHLLADLRGVLGIAVLEVAADHVLDDAVFGDVLRGRSSRSPCRRG